jgi:hypothetical protein
VEDLIEGETTSEEEEEDEEEELGGLGISDLKTLGWSLKMHWVWLQKTESRRPWADFNVHIPEQIQAFFCSSCLL